VKDTHRHVGEDERREDRLKKGNSWDAAESWHRCGTSSRNFAGTSDIIRGNIVCPFLACAVVHSVVSCLMSLFFFVVVSCFASVDVLCFDTYALLSQLFFLER
jgi:hypothetical protein